MGVMPLPKERAWFGQKKYGYGWGLPRRWQGWVVLIAYFAALFAGVPLAERSAGYFALYGFAISLVLVAICWWKGERPEWRWGDRE